MDRSIIDKNRGAVSTLQIWQTYHDTCHCRPSSDPFPAHYPTAVWYCRIEAGKLVYRSARFAIYPLEGPVDLRGRRRPPVPLHARCTRVCPSGALPIHMCGAFDISFIRACSGSSRAASTTERFRDRRRSGETGSFVNPKESTSCAAKRSGRKVFTAPMYRFVTPARVAASVWSSATAAWAMLAGVCPRCAV